MHKWKENFMRDDKKKELITKSAEEFSKLNEDNKMFILGYMFGIQQERQRADRKQPQTADRKSTRLNSSHRT